MCRSEAADDCQLEEMHKCRGTDLNEARSLEWPSKRRRQMATKEKEKKRRKEEKVEMEDGRSVVRLEYLPRRSCRDGLDGREQGGF